MKKLKIDVQQIIEMLTTEDATVHKTFRYCKSCGQKVWFYDSGIHRRNANGNHIYEFAIYKCDKDHTWNHKLGIYTPEKYGEDYTYNNEQKQTNPMEGLNIRLDKGLSLLYDNISRSQWQNHIKNGEVMVNGDMVKPKYSIKSHDLIEVNADIIFICYESDNDTEPDKSLVDKAI